MDRRIPYPKRRIQTLAPLVIFALLSLRPAHAGITETTAATGLSGGLTAAPGQEVQIFTVGLTGDGVKQVNAVDITLSDLTAATGIVKEDFTALKIYHSADAVLDGGDTEIGSKAQDDINFGAKTKLNVAPPHKPANGVEEFYIISALFTTTVTDGHAFKLSFGAGDIATNNGPKGTAVGASDANSMKADVVATRLVLTTQPAPLSTVSATNLDFTTDPVVEARDGYDNLDLDFSDVVTLTVQGAGSTTYANNAVAAVNGIATFSGLAVTYNAATDGESFALQANDTAGGPEGDIGDLPTTASISADVVATQLVFSTNPWPLAVTSGVLHDFGTDPVVVARDASGAIDTDFAETVTLVSVGPRAAAFGNNSAAAVNGVATFANLNLTYTANADGETFVLEANDQDGVGTDLPVTSSSQLVVSIPSSSSPPPPPPPPPESSTSAPVSTSSQSTTSTPSPAPAPAPEPQGPPPEPKWVELQVDVEALDFGVVQLGQRKSLPIIVSNPGNDRLEISSSSTDNGLFRLEPLTFRVDAESSAEVVVHFTPRWNPREERGVLTLGGNAPQLGLVELVGSGALPPKLQVATDAVDFGEVNLGSTVTRSITLTNTGGLPLIITDVGLSSALFQVPATSLEVPPESSLAVEVVFAPAEQGPIESQLTLVTAADAEPLQIALNGIATIAEIAEPEEGTAAEGAEPETEAEPASPLGEQPAEAAAQAAPESGTVEEAAAAIASTDEGTAGDPGDAPESTGADNAADAASSSSDESATDATDVAVDTETLGIDDTDAGDETPLAAPAALPACARADFNCDGAVNFDDLFLIADRFDRSDQSGFAAFDLNQDGELNAFDLNIFADEMQDGGYEAAKLIAQLGGEAELPAEFQLRPNYPNPFNSETTIEFMMPQAAPVQLTIFGITGQRVRTLVDGLQQAGRAQVRWDGRDGVGRAVANGTYFYVLQAGDQVQSRKLLLIK